MRDGWLQESYMMLSCTTVLPAQHTHRKASILDHTRILYLTMNLSTKMSRCRHTRGERRMRRKRREEKEKGKGQRKRR
jgi:hypothetical protein